MVQNRFYAAIENCKLSQECAEDAQDEKNDQAALFSKRYRFTGSVSGNQRNGESSKNIFLEIDEHLLRNVYHSLTPPER